MVIVGRTAEAVIYLLENTYVLPYGGMQSADLDAVLRKNDITHYAK